MATAEEQATAFKNEGNKAFANHDWFTAIDLYTKAIELNPKEPAYYSNRAQVFGLWTSPNGDRVTNFCRPTSSPRLMDMQSQTRQRLLSWIRTLLRYVVTQMLE
jgi:hypothetical protein